MRGRILAAVVLAALIPSVASAGERAGSAALGALSGAVILGPVGAVAGAVVGYTAGPAIARSWGIGPPRRAARSRKTSAVSGPRRAATPGTVSTSAYRAPTQPAPGASSVPVQGFN